MEGAQGSAERLAQAPVLHGACRELLCSPLGKPWPSHKALLAMLGNPCQDLQVAWWCCSAPRVVKAAQARCELAQHEP